MSSSLTHNRSATQRAEIPDEFLKQLKEDIAWRRIDSGLRCLAAHKDWSNRANCNKKTPRSCWGILPSGSTWGFRAENF